MGRKRSRGERGGGGDFGDQYGESMVSQDRDSRQTSGLSGKGGSGGGFSGGGEAGGSGRDPGLTAVRAVPKFLQGYAHLLGRKRPEDAPAEEEAQLATDEQEQEREREEQEEEGNREALEQAVMDNPDLVALYPELAHVADRARAGEAKEAGNRAFAAKDFPAAVRHFTEAIRLHQDAVYFSNRAAAHQALKQFRQAAADAREAVRLKPEWHKGWSRLGAAHAALEEWSEAKEAYDEAIRREPSDDTLRSARHRAEVAEAKQEADRVVRFKQSRAGGAKGKKAVGGGGTPAAAAGVRNKALLSFDDEEA